ncbi:MAG: histidine kinase [Ignavibacteriaceae bacterium]|nr:histidine kinase [Ignavibacteriaceae bacterium]
MPLTSQINLIKPSYLNDISLKKEKWSDKKRYWISQLSGWTVFILVNLSFNAVFEKITWQKIAVQLIISTAGIVLTHYFRFLIKKYKWIKLPIKKLFPRVLSACIFIGTLIFVCAFGANYLLGNLNNLNPIFIVVGIFNLSGVIAIWSLVYFSFHYFQNYKRVEIESYIWEAAVKDFELKTLKSQLNPHFIFNALNSIRALVDEDPKSAQTAITKLSNILRYSLKMERSETVSLDEEMQTVNDYLILEKMRLEERIKYNISIEPSSSKIPIPPMMVQTLVENGIKHGIAKRTEGGQISVSTKLINSNLLIEIINSGQIDEDMIKQSDGFGISNTKQRLNLIYGDSAKFEIKNNSDDSVSAEITIPLGDLK